MGHKGTAALSAALAAFLACAQRVPPEAISERLRERVEGNHVQVPQRLRAAVDRAVTALYARRSARAVWIEGDHPNAAGRRVLELLRDADREGLDPRDFGAARIDRRLAAVEQAPDRALALAELELALSRGAFAYALDRRGRIDPRTLAPRRAAPDELDPLIARLDADPIAAVAELAQHSAAESMLIGALRAYRAMGALPPLAGLSLFAHLARARAAVLEVNLERQRSFPAETAPRWVLINIPSQTLTVFTDGRPELSMKVVVGKKKTPTPLFDSALTEIITNPPWEVPETIARGELLPKIIRDRSVLEDQNLHVMERDGAGWSEVDPDTIPWDSVDPDSFASHLRQDPGPDNALGVLKFVAPNRYGIYLHDTPARNLFDRTVRAFSHGCVRVEKPRELAETLLGASRLKELSEKMGDDEPKSLALDPPIPVHLVYWTVGQDVEHGLQQYADVYHRDARTRAALLRLRASEESQESQDLAEETSGREHAS